MPVLGEMNGDYHNDSFRPSENKKLVLNVVEERKESSNKPFLDKIKTILRKLIMTNKAPNSLKA